MGAGLASLPRSFAATKPWAPAVHSAENRRPRLPSPNPPMAEICAKPYMRVMRKIALILPLLAMLAGSIWFAYFVWITDDGPPMPVTGYVAMALGILFSLLIGIGLMALVFYSHRHGYDERAQGETGQDRN